MQLPNQPQTIHLRDVYDVVVVGGGLAGCSSAIHLARRGFTVLLAERQRYPAHKLCGEFLSTESGALLDRLGVLEKVEAAGAHAIRRTRLTSASGRVLEVQLPGIARGVSRFRLDEILLNQARNCGAHVRDGCPVTDVSELPGGGFRVQIPDGEVQARFVIGAHGKRSRLDGRLSRSFLTQQSPLVGFKAHFVGDHLGDCIEMHAFPGGYCGLSHVEGGRVNVCWLAHAQALKRGDGSAEGMLERVLPTNPYLAERLARMHRVSDRFEAVAQVQFRQKGLFDGGLCMVGDTAAMITPLCGDGMSMALHSAEIVVPLVADHLNGRLDRVDFERAYQYAWQRQFARRLQVGRLLHQVFVHPLASEVAVRAGKAWPALSGWMVRSTRGASVSA